MSFKYLQPQSTALLKPLQTNKAIAFYLSRETVYYVKLKRLAYRGIGEEVAGNWLCGTYIPCLSSSPLTPSGRMQAMIKLCWCFESLRKTTL